MAAVVAAGHVVGARDFTSDVEECAFDGEIQDAEAAYDEAEALRFLQYGRAAFCTPRHLEQWDCGDICDAVAVRPGSVRVAGPSQRHKVQGFVAELPRGGCLASIRGTVNFSNWVADVETWTEAWPPGGAAWCPGCSVHHGFAAAYMELRTELLAAVAELRCAVVAVTGHSLGAAIAALAALELRAGLGLAVSPVYLFGAPRIGNCAFARAFESAAGAQGVAPAAWRVVHYRDPVARIPFRSMGFAHLAREVYYYTEDERAYQECSPRPEDPTCSSGTPLWMCINLDHVTYLNLTLRHTQLGPACTADGEQEVSVQFI